MGVRQNLTPATLARRRVATQSSGSQKTIGCNNLFDDSMTSPL